MSKSFGSLQLLHSSRNSQNKFWLDSVHAVIISILLIGCSPISIPTLEVIKGSSKSEVIESLGEPDQTQDFILPDAPFFGPQESLSSLVPAGTVIEEWVYEIDDDVLYVWFTGEVGKLREDWLVLATAKYPKDAVY